jgi:hypothetical protein
MEELGARKSLIETGNILFWKTQETYKAFDKHVEMQMKYLKK